MTSDLAKSLLLVARSIQADADQIWKPPSEGSPAQSERVVLFSLVSGTRGYIEQIVHQINGSYENGWYDACCVMTRRLVETLIIEAFEHYDIDHQIKTPSGDFLYLRDLIQETLACESWNLSRNTRQALPKLKDIGDKSAHSRRFTAHRGDIDKVVGDLRVVVQELVYLSGLK